MSEPPDPSQSDVIAFLRQPCSWPHPGAAVDVIETHGALVFMCGADALKIKRSVRLPYFDFSTLERRHTFIAREYAVNAANAPEIYRAVVPITREPDGHLTIAGHGDPVEWALFMRRFDQDHLLSHIADHGGLTKTMSIALADAVAAAHAKAPRARAGADVTLAAAAERILAALATSQDRCVRTPTAQLVAMLRQAAASSQSVRDARARDGYVRRCHGDLHLGNIVLWNDKPVLFDALEFDEQMATVDTLYDLAFLLMDLERHQARTAANFIFNRYLWRTGDPRDLEALAALPFFLSLRAAIRAMVALDRANAKPAERETLTAHAVETLNLAVTLTMPAPPRLIAIGGLSGTGKTSLAACLAPLAGSAPGALHLRTDLERKWLAGAGEFEHLPQSAYTKEASVAVFERVHIRARLALTAGHSVLIDGVFALPEERAAVEAVARDTGACFNGLWLEAPADLLKRRVAARIADASDATSAVVEKQLAMDIGEVTWPRLMSSGAPDTTYRAAMARLDLGNGIPQALRPY